MQVESQTTEDLLGRLSRLEVEWQDALSNKAIDRLENLERKSEYSSEDIKDLLSHDFDSGSLIVRLFMGLSKDAFEAEKAVLLGTGNAGKNFYRKKPDEYVDALIELGLLKSMNHEINRSLQWYDVLVERLRSGRGSAVAGQKRGRLVEDFVENIVKSTFEDGYDARCNFIGQRDQVAKCDFAIPNRIRPSIVIEAKGYDATGSKMTDVIGDIEKIISAKRQDTAFLMFTDGTSWLQRRSDFVKIVEYQNRGDITKIYTLKMASEFERDLGQLKSENSPVV